MRVSKKESKLPKRISQAQLVVEKQELFNFLAGLHETGFRPTEVLYNAYCKRFPETELSLKGFGRLLPKHLVHEMKFMNGKLYRGVIFT